MTDISSDVTSLVVRRAVAADAEKIAALVNSAYRGESSRAGWTTEADLLGGQRTSEKVLLREFADPNRVILWVSTKVNPGELIATVGLERFQDSRGVGCYLGMLTVKPTLQAGGMGRWLLQEAEGFARGWGAARMKLTVIQVREELMAWYERRGYVRTGERSEFPYGDSDFGEPARSDLHFLVFEKSLI